MTFSKKSSLAAMVVAFFGLVLLALGLFAPALGLGERDDFVFYRMTGIARKPLIYIGILVFVIAILAEAIHLLFYSLVRRWREAIRFPAHAGTHISAVARNRFSLSLPLKLLPSIAKPRISLKPPSITAFIREHLPLSFTAATILIFLVLIWILPAKGNGPTLWTTEVIRQYSLVASGDQRRAYSIAVLLTATLAIAMFVMTRAHVLSRQVTFQGPKLNFVVSAAFVIIALVGYALVIPHWLIAWACVMMAALLLILIAGPTLGVKAIERTVIAAIGAYLVILVVPGFLVGPITLMESDPNALSQFEQHLLLMTMPGSSILAGQNYFAGLPYDYGMLFPSIMSVVGRYFGALNVGDQLRFVQYSQLIFSVSAVAAYFAYRPRAPFAILIVVLLAGPFWATAGLGIWHPNQTGYRSDGFPVGFLVLALVARMPPSRSSWILGAVAGIAILTNLETAVALSAGYSVFLMARTQSFPVLRYLQCAAAGVTAMIAYLAIYAFALGRLPFAHSVAPLYAYLGRYLAGDFGGRLFSGGEYNTNYFVVPFAIIMFAHAIYAIIDGFRMLAEGPLPPRRAFRVAVSTTLVVWMAYYFNAPNWWQIWTLLFLYGFLLIDLLDHRYFGVRSSALSDSWRRLLRTRITAPRLLVLFLLTLYIPETSHRLNLYLRTFMYPNWTHQQDEVTTVSGIAMPAAIAQALQAKAHKLAELYAASGGRLTYLTFNMTLMPALTGIFEPDPYRDLWVGVPGDAAFDPIMQALLDKHSPMILIDSPTGPLAISGARKSFQDRVRHALARGYYLTDTVDGWQIWQPIKSSQKIDPYDFLSAPLHS